MENLLLTVLMLRLQVAQMSLESYKTPQVMVAEMTPEDYRAYASTTAERYGIDPVPFVGTLAHESDYVSDAAGDFDASTKEYTSFGCAQIHLVAHPDVTKTQAQDCIWSIEWTAKQFAKGNQKMWTAWRIYYGKDSHPNV